MGGLSTQSTLRTDSTRSSRQSGRGAGGRPPPHTALRMDAGPGGYRKNSNRAGVDRCVHHFPKISQVPKCCRTKFFSRRVADKRKCIAGGLDATALSLARTSSAQKKDPARTRGREGRRGNEHWRESQTRASLGGPLLCRSSAYQTTS